MLRRYAFLSILTTMFTVVRLNFASDHHSLALTTSGLEGRVVSFAVGGAEPKQTSPPAMPEYRIETLAGNGQPGDLPEGTIKAVEAPVDLPFGVTVGPGGALYITTVGSHRVLRLNRQTGELTSVAGNGRKGYAGDGGPATQASLNEPYDVRFDSHGNMLILEMQNHVIRRVDARSQLITTLAGDGVAGDRGDGGPARSARLNIPHSLAIDQHDNIYVSDLGNHRVRRIDAASAHIETIAGDGQAALPTEGGQARSESFLTPQGLSVDRSHLWIASVSGNSLWRLDLDDGTIHRVAGTGKRGYSGDGDDPLTATFDGPRGIASTPSGIVYVVEGENNVIRAIDTNAHAIWTVAGVGPDQHAYAGDGIIATRAPLWQPHVVCVTGETLIVSDTINHRVRSLIPLAPQDP